MNKQELEELKENILENDHWGFGQELLDYIDRLEKALDKCKEQRNSLLGHSDGKLMMRGKYDSELDKILIGEEN
jgi:acyl transferase domain-containing protein